MPRKVRDAALDTRTARAKLKARAKPYFRLIGGGLHIGYRKLAKGPGTWVARRYVGEGKYTVENLRTHDRIVYADDFQDADGEAVMTFAQAQSAVGIAPKPKAGPFSVADALSRYLEMAKAEGRSEHSINDTKYRIAIINETLGDRPVADLTSDDLEKFRNTLAATPRRKRTSRGQSQRFQAMPTDDDGKRSRRSSANRTFALLKAALNKAYDDDKATSDKAWSKVGTFKKTSAARVRYLTKEEAQRLVNACDPDLRLLVRGGLATGARYSELGHVVVSDFDVKNGTLAIRRSKSGKSRHVVLNDEGVGLFRSLTIGKRSDAPAFVKLDGTVWGQNHQTPRMSAAVERAKLERGISFHTLRHTWASLAVMSGMPLMVVAKNLGHRDTRMIEEHYGHLAPSYVADAIRQHAPTFGFSNETNVRGMGR
jgi:integrase